MVYLYIDSGGLLAGDANVKKEEEEAQEEGDDRYYGAEEQKMTDGNIIGIYITGRRAQLG